MVEQEKYFELRQDNNSAFKKFLKIIDRRNSRAFYAVIKHEQLSPAYSYWLQIDSDVKNEVPSLISVNLFSKLSEPAIHERAMEIWPLLTGKAPVNTLIIEELKRIAKITLAPLQSLENVGDLAGDNNDYRFFHSESLRIFWRASVRILNAGEINKSLEMEEEFYGKPLKHRDRFIRYWENTLA